MQTQTITIRLDPQLKQEASDLFESLGINLSSAINVFLRKAVSCEGFPFAVRREQYNRKLDQAVAEADALLKSKDTVYYSSAQEVMEALNQ